MHALPSPPLQLVTGGWTDLADLLRRVDAALRGGVRWLQLRAKERSALELHEAALALAPRLREAGALFVVNDRADVAVACGAGGVHLPENAMSSALARRLLGDDAWIARSVHSVAAIEKADAAALDAVQFGPVFDTPSKREFGAPQGLDELARAASAARRRGLRLLAVGGVGPGGAERSLAGGADALSVIAAIWNAVDVEAAARDLVQRTA